MPGGKVKGSAHVHCWTTHTTHRPHYYHQSQIFGKGIYDCFTHTFCVSQQPAAVEALDPSRNGGQSDFNTASRALLLPLPPLRVSIPNTLGEQAVQIGKISVVVDEEVEAFAIFFARPFAGPRLPSRIMRVEVLATEC